MPEDFLDVDPEAVAAAGGRTAAGATDWAAWAGRVETLLRDAATGANDSTVSAAVEQHLSALNPQLHQLAANTEALGTNATSAACVVSDADQTGATELGRLAGTWQPLTSWLTRPIAAGAEVPGA